MAVAGKKYRVLRDSAKNFKPNDIVVAIETGNLVYCVPDSLYVKGFGWRDYKRAGYIPMALYDREIEEIKEREVK